MEIEIFETFKHRINVLLAVLRAKSHINNVKELHIISLLIVLFSKGVFNGIDCLNVNQVKSDIKAFVSGHSLFNEVFNVFEPIFDRLNENVLIDILHRLFSLDVITLKEHLPDVIDDIIFQISESEGRSGGEYLQPLELSRFVCDFYNFKKGVKIYNPFAGVASFPISFNNTMDYYGEEFNDFTWALGMLRLIAHGKEEHCNYLCKDSLRDVSLNSEKFDFVVTTPPFNLAFSESQTYLLRNQAFFNKNNANAFIVNKCIASLNSEGKAIIAVPNGFLANQNRNDRKLIEKIVHDDILEMVISFPGGVLRNTNIPFSLIVINKAKEAKSKIRFLIADSCLYEVQNNNRKINEYALNTIIQSKNNKNITTVDTKDIVANKFVLIAHRYFQQEVEGEGIGNVLAVVKGERIEDITRGKFVRIRDLKNDPLNSIITVDDIQESDFKGAIKQINESVLLLASKWKTLKPTWFEYTGSPIYISSNVLAFKIDIKKIDPFYLVNELSSDSISDQIISLSRGTVIPFISKSDLLTLKINLIPLNEQRAKVKGVQEAAIKLKLIEAERDALAYGLDDLVYQNFSSIKHAMGKPLLNIGSSLRNISNALDKLDPNWIKIMVNKKHNHTIGDSFNSIYSNLDLISNLLKNNENELEIKNYELNSIDIMPFIKGYVTQLKVDSNENVTIDLDISPDIKSEFDNHIDVIGNEDLLRIALYEIIDNAHNHGFIDETKNYRISFKLNIQPIKKIEEIDGKPYGTTVDYVKIEISNDGIPFPESYTFEKYIRKNSFAGDTGNTGQGGYQVNKIIEYHKGKFDLRLYSKDVVNDPVACILLLPINSRRND